MRSLRVLSHVVSVGNNASVRGREIIAGDSSGGGGGAVLVYLHDALGDASRAWAGIPELVAGKLSGRSRSIVFDRLGHGLSSARPGEFTPALHVEESERLGKLLAQLDAQRNVVLVGYSDGATIALVHAATAPATTTSIKGLFLIAPHIVVEDKMRVGVQAVKEKRDAVVPSLVKIHGPEKGPRLFDSWASLWTSDLMRDQFDLRPMLARSAQRLAQIPVCVVQGTEDEYGTVEKQIDPLRTVFPKLELHEIAGATHAAHLAMDKRPTRGLKKPNDFVVNLLLQKATQWFS